VSWSVGITTGEFFVRADARAGTRKRMSDMHNEVRRMTILHQHQGDRKGTPLLYTNLAG
jgi:hypothetical protein